MGGGEGLNVIEGVMVWCFQTLCCEALLVEESESFWLVSYQGG